MNVLTFMVLLKYLHRLPTSEDYYVSVTMSMTLFLQLTSPKIGGSSASYFSQKERYMTRLYRKDISDKLLIVFVFKMTGTCFSLLCIKSINSYSPWMAIAKVNQDTWSLVRKTFEMFENGEVKGIAVPVFIYLTLN